MKRLDSYLAVFGSSDLPLDSDFGSSKTHFGESKLFTSWHKACDFVRQSFESGEIAGGKDGFIVDAKTKRVVIRFSAAGIETNERESAVGDAWEAKSRGSLDDGRRVIEFSNVRDFAWEFLEGAKRDVPFRLSYLERNAERKSWCKSLLMEVQKFRDMFGRSSF